MYENFERISADEQERILSACIHEFGEKGYRRASTNAIVKEAGIPKGTLFYFFGSKKNCFLYTLDYAIGKYIAEFKRHAGGLPSDLFDRFLRRSEIRMNFAIHRPRLYQLFFNSFLDTPEDIRKEIESRYAGYAAESARIMKEGLDRSKLRSEVDLDQAIQITSLVLEGIYSRYQPTLRKAGPEAALDIIHDLRQDVRQYFALLKRGLYVE